MGSRLDRWMDERIDRALTLDSAPVDQEQRRAVELFFVISLAGIVISACAAALFFAFDQRGLAASSAATSTILFATRVALQRRLVGLDAAMLIFCLVPLFTVSLNSLHLGGIASPSMAWFPIFIIFAFQLLGRRSALVFSAITVATLALLARLDTIVDVTPSRLTFFRSATLLLAIAFAVVMGASIDRVRRRAVERLIRAKREAEAANRAKSEFLATVSHELRTPLHAITSITDLLRRDEALAGAPRERAAVAREAARSLLGLVDDLLDRAALEAGRVTLRPVPTDMPALAREVRELLAIPAAERRIGVSLKADGPAQRVLVDPARVRQILMNVLGNAIKFVDGGHVEIAVGTEPAGAGAVRVTMSVTDDGGGIPADRLDAIFERFGRVDEGGEPKEGSGLGLAIARDLLRLMGGDLVVQSTLGVGSTFVATLVAPVVEDDDALRGRRVLLADDERVSRQVTAWLLESLGCTVERADGGVEAVHLATTRAYDAILLDCHMPDVGGFECARRIRASGRIDVPILAFTAGTENREGALTAGMDDFLQKPIDCESLRAALLKHVRSRRGVDASAPPSP